jgi:hypothetical protein
VRQPRTLRAPLRAAGIRLVQVQVRKQIALTAA